MVTKEKIKATVEDILNTYPKLKEIIDYDIPWKINKTDAAIMIELSGGEYLPGWDCIITSTNENQFGGNGFIAFSFNDEGVPHSVLVSDMGRPDIGYISKDANGKYKISGEK